MSLITNDTHTHKGESDKSSLIHSRIAKSKKLSFKDDNGDIHEHTITQYVVESDDCPVDQLLSADDFKLKRLIELGANLQRITFQPRDRFETLDLAMNALSSLQKQELAASASHAAAPEGALEPASSEPASSN